MPEVQCSGGTRGGKLLLLRAATQLNANVVRCFAVFATKERMLIP